MHRLAVLPCVCASAAFQLVSLAKQSHRFLELCCVCCGLPAFVVATPAFSAADCSTGKRPCCYPRSTCITRESLSVRLLRVCAEGCLKKLLLGCYLHWSLMLPRFFNESRMLFHSLLPILEEGFSVACRLPLVLFKRYSASRQHGSCRPEK